MSTIYLQGLLQTTALISPSKVSALLKTTKASLTPPTVAAIGPTLRTLSLTNSSVTENTAAGTIIGQIANTTSGSTVTMAPGGDAGGRVTTLYQTGIWYLVTTAVPFDYETATSYTIDLVETLSPAIGSPKTTSGLTLAVANQNDTNPDAFNFTGVSGAPLGTIETSNVITVSGLGASDSANAAVSGDPSSQMQVNGGAWGAGPATVVNGDTVAVRHTSSATNSTAVSTTLTVGTTSATFTSTTAAAFAPILALGMNVNWLTYWTGMQVMVDLVGTQDGITCVGTGFNTTGSTTLDSYTVSSIASMANITVGMAVSGAGIPSDGAGTRVVAIDAGTSSVTLSRPATATAAGVALAFTFNGVQVPAVYCDANGYPNANPPGVTAFQIILNQSATSKPHKMVWTGTLSNPTPGNVFSGVGPIVGNSITFTPAALQAGSDAYTYFRWQIAGGGSYASKLSCRPVDDTGDLVAPEFVSIIQALTSTTGYYRPIHMTDAEHTRRDDSTLVNKALVDPSDDQSYPALAFPTDANGQLLRPILTATNRNTLDTANWGGGDRVPIEVHVLVANACNRNLKLNLSLWADDTYYNKIWDVIINGNPAQNVPPLKAGLKVQISPGNENWNDGDYIDPWMLKNEAASLGITWHQRYAQVCDHLFGLAKTAFAAAGRSADLVCCAEWQEAADPAVWDEFKAVGTFDANTDMYSVAIYWGPDGVDLDAATPPTAAEVAAALYSGADTSFALAKTHFDKADKHGKLKGAYEGGLSLPADGAHSALQESLTVAPEMHDPMAYALNEAARLFGPDFAWCNFSLTGANGLYREWGIIDVITTPITSSTPKPLAIKEFLQRQYTLFDVTYTGGGVNATAPAGTVVATIVKHHPDAVLSISDPSGNFALSGLDIVTTGADVPGGDYAVDVIQTPPIGTAKTTSITLHSLANDAGAMAWDPAHTAAGITLSNTNADAAGTNADTNIRATMSVGGLASGKWYAEVSSHANDGITSFGLAMAGASLINHAGDDANAMGWRNNGDVYIAGALARATGNSHDWNTYGIQFDLDAGLAWFRLENGAWIGTQSGADPETGLYGFDISALTGALHIIWSVQSDTVHNGHVTLNHAGTMVYAPTASFTAIPATVS